MVEVERSNKMGRLSREKKERKDSFYRRLLKESRQEKGVNYFEINGHQTALNPLKHILKGIPYKNREMQILLRRTLDQYKSYVNQLNQQAQENLESTS
ncbi:MAG: hypothetical protein LBF97_03860 [Elusimicrobiota bacterium]|jgi:hypothetical protein|nr:hypothetical protein [Elusimicrobiota bacterium]